jgi:phage protein D
VTGQPGAFASPADLVTVVPSVSLGKDATPLREAVAARLEHVVVDNHLHLPDMFEITFYDRDCDVTTRAGITIGTIVTISSGSARQLIVGEVTSIEGSYGDVNRTVLRGYTKDQRLQRVKRSRTFLNMKEGDIARKIATDAGLDFDDAGDTEKLDTLHQHVVQVNQTDWDFLRGRATMLGYDFGFSGGKLFLRASSAAKETPVPLAFPYDLRTFLPRVTSGNLGEQAEVRAWDPNAATVVSAVSPTATTSARPGSAQPGQLAAVFAATAAAGEEPSSGSGDAEDDPALARLGPPPIENGDVTIGCPDALDAAAAAAAEHVGSTFAEAEGEANGDPALRPGVPVEVSGVAPEFVGTWTLTRTRHVFAGDGYHTAFEVSGRHVRSLLGLASGGAGTEQCERIPGLVTAIVSNTNDDSKQGRVKLVLPWLSPMFETDWAPVVQAGAGQRSGTTFLPEVGDEVLVGFELGDPNRPYVLGGVPNVNSRFSVGGEPVKAVGETGTVVWRGVASPSGNRLAFHDELPPGEGDQPPSASELVLGTGTGDLSLTIDQVAGTVVLLCSPSSLDGMGHLTIECGAGGTVDIKAGADGTVNVDGGAELDLTAKAVKLTGETISIESNGLVEVKGSEIKLN